MNTGGRFLLLTSNTKVKHEIYEIAHKLTEEERELLPLFKIHIRKSFPQYGIITCLK